MGAMATLTAATDSLSFHLTHTHRSMSRTVSAVRFYLGDDLLLQSKGVIPAKAGIQ
jgi:hypothetical protein